METKIAKPKVIISAVVTRANGKVEDLGEINSISTQPEICTSEAKVEEEKQYGRRS